MNSKWKYVLLLLIAYFPIQGNSQISDYLPLFSYYGGAEVGASKLKTSNDLTYFSGGSMQNIHAKFGANLFRVLDAEALLGYDFRRVKEEIPVTCIDGFCPDLTYRHSQNITLGYAVRFRFPWVAFDAGDGAIYPFLKYMNHAEFSTVKKSRSLVDDKWFNVANNDMNKPGGFMFFTFGFDYLTEYTMFNLGFNLKYGQIGYTGDNVTLGIGAEAGFAFIIDAN